MGGCCCSLRGTESVRGPVYHNCPQETEGHGSLSPTCGTSSAASTGLLVDKNLETSLPNTAPTSPVQLPYESPASLQTMVENPPNLSDKTDDMLTEDSQPIVGADVRIVGSDTFVDLEKPDTKIKPGAMTDSSTLTEDDSPKLYETIASPLKNETVALDMEEEDDCPICLEEYEEDNPYIATKCVHHFHLSCILEWMERSDTCPICDKVINASDVLL